MTRGSRAALERHQTLRNTIDWSYELLDGSERRALHRISVFAGGCDLPAAEAVIGDEDIDAFDVVDVVDVVGQLVDKSLVLAELEDDGRLRYRLLETLRQYAQERLEASGEAARIRRRHADHFMAVAEQAGVGLRSPDQLHWARVVAREVDNLRTALDWAVETESPDHALRIVAAIAVTRTAIGESASAWAELAIGVPGAADHRLFPDAASLAVYSAIARGDVALAEHYGTIVEDAEARLGPGSATAITGPAMLAYLRGDLEAARAHDEEWIARARRDGDAAELSGALIALSIVHGATGDHARDVELAEEALVAARASGIPTALATVLGQVPWSLLGDDPPRALQLLDEAVEVSTEIGDPFLVSMAMCGRGVYYDDQGDWPRALDEVQVAIDRLTEVGTVTALIGGILGVAAVALAGLGHSEAGASCLGASYRFAPGAHARAEQLRVDAAAKLVEHLGQPRYDALFARGTELSADAALTELVATLAAVRTSTAS